MEQMPRDTLLARKEASFRMTFTICYHWVKRKKEKQDKCVFHLGTKYVIWKDAQETKIVGCLLENKLSK